MIYFTSDLHFGHDKPFLYESRGFRTIYEHDIALVSNWNSIVNHNDDVYILGDIMLNDNEQGIKNFKALNGRKHIIIGNHDTNARVELYKQCHNTEVLGYAIPFKYHKYNFFLSHYPSYTNNYDSDKPLKARVINLCGHYHTQDKYDDMARNMLSYHIELDAHNNTPVPINTIIEDIKSYPRS